jgi:predicted nuclease of restriction endonuclease-like (RecB) superfamily
MSLILDNTNTELALYSQLSLLIEQSKKEIAIRANSALTLLFWNVGFRINESILGNKRADYGKYIVPILSQQLVEKYGRNFEERNLRRMVQFATDFPDISIVAPLAPQLSWSHFQILMTIKNKEAQMFYAHKSIEESLGKRDLKKQIDEKTFERTTIANIQNRTENTEIFNIFKDPYFLDFAGLNLGYLETDLEEAIIRELESFILSLGKGFTFIERQKRMIIDSKDFYLDLLFYHRKLKRLVAIELKIGAFKAKHKGQMELYLKWLDKYEKQEGENNPIGLILCAESSREQVELLEMHKDGIMVAEYWTELPSKAELELKLHSLIIEAKERIERNKIEK